MKTEPEKILEKILFPLNSQWEVSSVYTDSDREEIFVHLRYRLDYIEDSGVRYRICDHRKERKWRHLDLWQYKTFPVAQIPRYKESQGFFKSLEVPWADEYERLTALLEKKRQTPCYRLRVRQIPHISFVSVSSRCTGLCSVP
jgi:hypothetical protein